LSRFGIVEGDHREQFVWIIGIKVVQLASPIVMDDDDELIAAPRLELELAADAGEIRFTDSGHAKHPPYVRSITAWRHKRCLSFMAKRLLMSSGTCPRAT
jgi:hypothetical protein